MSKPDIPLKNNSNNSANYSYGDKVLFGFPNRTYFELYKGTCKSDKVYSVQTKDFQEDVAAVIYYPNQNVNIDVDKFQEKAAVGKQHIFVEATEDLAAFLKSRGIELESLYYVDAMDKGKGMATIKNAGWVNPVAFDWVALEDVEIEEGSENNPSQDESDKKSSSKTKAIVATIIAALALFN